MRYWYADGSTLKVLSALTVMPDALPPESVRPVTLSVSLVSTSVAPDSRSIVNTASASSAEPVIAPVTVGTSFVPVIVIVRV